MFTDQYNSWKSFRFENTKFLAMETKEQHWYIVDEAMNVYGSYWSIESFKKMYKVQRENAIIQNAKKVRCKRCKAWFDPKRNAALLGDHPWVSQFCATPCFLDYKNQQNKENAKLEDNH